MTARPGASESGTNPGRSSPAGSGLAAQLDERLAGVIASIGESLLGMGDGCGTDRADVEDGAAGAADVGGADGPQVDVLAPDAHLELVARTSLALGRLELMLGQAVGAARAAGQSWHAIGNVLGTSRQGAQQRFGADMATPAVAASGASAASTAGSDVDAVGAHGKAPRRVLAPVTAFTEMAALARAGRYGWRSVAFGAFHHVLERDDHEWEHRRAFMWEGSRAQLEDRGWELVGDSFPWVYYRRRTDRPALAGDVSDEELLGD